MTIGIGYHCWKGIVLAADTLIILGPDVQEGEKLSLTWTKHGSLAFVNSSDDANATATLIDDIFHEVKAAPEIKTYRELGNIIKKSMTDWRSGFTTTRPPTTQLILGVKLKTENQSKLFLCEPPNTFTEKDDYVAVGAGASVTDPLYEILFGNNGGDHTDVQDILRRVSYLIYRAKQSSWMCGKRTDSAIVYRDDQEPRSVVRVDMEVAESAARMLDFLLSSAAIFSLQEDEQVVETNASGLADMLKSFKSLRSTQFHDSYGDLIKL